MPKSYYISEKQMVEIEHVRKTNKNRSVENRVKALLLHARKEKKSVPTLLKKQGFRNHI